MLIIGHRGASAVAPENTMASFREAIAVGADGIEFDVRLTRDGVPVIIHDSTLRRTGGLPHRVAELSSAELAKIDVGSWFAERKGLSPGTFANETVPSLAELFTFFQSNNSTLYLEMKCDSPSEQRALAEACVRAIDEYDFKERVIVECFQLPALKILKEIDPEIKTVALFEPTFTNPSVLSDQRIINHALEIGAAALALHHRLAREGLVQKAKAAGLHVAVWTVDDPAWIERARAIGIDALITNDPAAMLGHR
jgi:glycerophosphoryl diester phosphodiesterase